MQSRNVHAVIFALQLIFHADTLSVTQSNAGLSLLPDELIGASDGKDKSETEAKLRSEKWREKGSSVDQSKAFSERLADKNPEIAARLQGPSEIDWDSSGIDRGMLKVLERVERLRIDNSFGEFEGGKDVVIRLQDFQVQPNGNYQFEYLQSDYQHREEIGAFEHDSSSNDHHFTVNGFYEYIRPDGQRQRVEYVAGKDGFVPNVMMIKKEFGIE